MEQTGVVINIPPPTMHKDEMTAAGEKEGVAAAVKMITNIYEEKVRLAGLSINHVTYFISKLTKMTTH